MREIMGEYDNGLKKLFGSFRKRFGLAHSETLEYVDRMIDDKEYAILYFASDITYSKELIEEINTLGVGQAFGFYKDGPMAFNSLDEIREAVPRIIGDGGNKFIFVELEERSRFRLEDVAMSIFIKQGREKGEMVVDIVKSREYIKDEVIKKMEKTEQDEFNQLYNKLYRRRWEQRNEMFVRNIKMTPSELARVCNRSNDIGAFVCIKNGKVVGFIIYESITDKDNRAFEDRYNLTIRDIYVEEEYRRQGIATRLFREVTRLADKSNARTIRFKTWAFDSETNGFIESLNKKVLYTMYEVSI